jgi:hypothetical protein
MQLPLSLALEQFFKATQQQLPLSLALEYRPGVSR